MISNNFLLLFPTDFTKVAEAALNHAINLADKLQGELCLLHIVSKESNLEPAIAKLTYITEKVSNEKNITTRFIARVGNIFDDIGDVAAEIGAKLIVMGTHGMTGFQKITGSHALKVITNSSVPFIVVQENIEIHEYKKIVFPIDLSRESKQKINTTLLLAERFKSKIYIVTSQTEGKMELSSLEKNLESAKTFLSNHAIDFEVCSVHGEQFAQQIVDFSKKINADLIAIVNTSEGNIVGSVEAQQIISNDAKIPVLCVNSSVSYSSGMMFM